MQYQRNPNHDIVVVWFGPSETVTRLVGRDCSGNDLQNCGHRHLACTQEREKVLLPCAGIANPCRFSGPRGQHIAPFAVTKPSLHFVILRMCEVTRTRTCNAQLLRTSSIGQQVVVGNMHFVTGSAQRSVCT